MITQVNEKVRIEDGPCIVTKECTLAILSKNAKYRLGGPDSYGKTIVVGKPMSFVDKNVWRHKVYQWSLNGSGEFNNPHPDGGRYIKRSEFDTLEEALTFAKMLTEEISHAIH